MRRTFAAPFALSVFLASACKSPQPIKITDLGFIGTGKPACSDKATPAPNNENASAAFYYAGTLENGLQKNGQICVPCNVILDPESSDPVSNTRKAIHEQLETLGLEPSDDNLEGAYTDAHIGAAENCRSLEKPGNPAP